LPPLPPRAPRRARREEGDPHADGTPAELGRGPRDDWDDAPDDRWDRPRRDEQDW
jgi:hypothetical protein